MNRVLSALLAATLASTTFAVSAVAQFNGPASSHTTETSQPSSLTADHDLLYPQAHDQVLSVGDLIAVRIFGEQDYNPVVRIGTDGTALLPFIGSVPLKGISVTEAEIFLAKKLVDAGIYVNPQVTISVTEGPNAVVTLIGEAHGVIPVTGTRRLLDVISAAGGLPATASHIVTINRPGAAQPIVVDLGSDPLRSELGNIPVFAGDTIVIARIGVVYIMGSFQKQGVIPLTSYSPLTLTQATALSGGTTFDGKFSDLRIIRTVGDHRTVVKLDIHAVLYGKAPDPILQPDDIVFLPNSALKSAIASGGLGTLLGAASLAVAVAIR